MTVAPLDIHASNVSPLAPDCKAAPKLRRHVMREAAGQVLKRERVARCGRKALGGAVSVHRASPGHHHFSGVETCGSVWTCPVCAVKITEGRREELETLLRAHHGAGGSAYMMTLTIPHYAAQRCAELKTVVADTWRRVKQGEPWKRTKARSGYIGDVRALEVTHGGNGWHPHLHVLIFFKPDTDADQAAYFAEWVFERWARRVEKAGFGFCSRDAFTFDPVSEGGGAADYVGKWGASLELTKAHTKRAGNGGRTPWQILADIEERGWARDKALFKEYARAFKGARQLTWSRGLRERYSLVPEKTDTELAEPPSLPETHVASIDKPLWRLICKKRLTAKVLVALDRGGERAAVALLEQYGLRLRVETRHSLEVGRCVPWLLFEQGRSQWPDSSNRFDWSAPSANRACGNRFSGSGGDPGNSLNSLKTHGGPVPGNAGAFAQTDMEG